jgi:hypothetical protein
MTEGERTFTAHGLEFVILTETYVTEADLDLIRDHLKEFFADEEHAMQMHRENAGAFTVGDEDGPRDDCLMVGFRSSAGRIWITDADRLSKDVAN